jgi:Xaa-Pro aminopeptidase
MYINPAKIRFAKKLKSHTKDKLVDARSTFAHIRSIKSATEIQAIRTAVAITQQSLDELRSQLAHMKNERDIEVLLTYEFMKRGAEGHAYDPIIASGIHATTIHYDKNNGPLANDELVLLDVGAAYNGYAADISRTWAVGNKATSRQQELFDVVHDVQQYAMSLLRPGTVLREYEAKVRDYMNTHLARVGLMQVGDKSASTHYFPHLCSHFLGLDVHDAGVYDEPLQAGMVLTVEPGLYVPEESIGIRLEDNVLITSTGIENLSKDIPSTLLY